MGVGLLGVLAGKQLEARGAQKGAARKQGEVFEVEHNDRFLSM